jgi:uncharacterized protein YuzE
VKIHYDSRVDAAYIYLDETSTRNVSRTLACDPTSEMINLDFDFEGHLIGIEVLAASKVLSPALLRTAIRTDGS